MRKGDVLVCTRIGLWILKAKRGVFSYCNFASTSFVISFVSLICLSKAVIFASKFACARTKYTSITEGEHGIQSSWLRLCQFAAALGKTEGEGRYLLWVTVEKEMLGQ